MRPHSQTACLTLTLYALSTSFNVVILKLKKGLKINEPFWRKKIIAYLHELSQNKFLKIFFFIFFLMTSSTPPLPYSCIPNPPYFSWMGSTHLVTPSNLKSHLILCKKSVKKCTFYRYPFFQGGSILLPLSCIVPCCQTAQLCLMNVLLSPSTRCEDFKNV